ncbi:phosphonate ABC transporter, permease protein PhnE [Jannaschia sp. 2305UL9-9]|uniref:phosphonate ABC transporter, permease protein PhnE n=1 Tax=Jannaschia sp. 2305UL9-9 TaxID=3121638 RepID=UPI003528E454
MNADAILAADRRRRRRKGLTALAGVGAVAVCLAITGFFDGARLAGGVPAIGTLLSEMVPPDFSRWRAWIWPLVETLAMSVAGTALALAAAVPLGLLAARDTAPGTITYGTARLILNVLRALPELILGIVFVAAVGFGMLPGVLALGLHSIGMLGKFLAEAVEHADTGPIEAVQAAGAAPLQVVSHGIMPQVFPRLVDMSIYRWEYNFRASTVMGMVGAGGIGTDLIGALRILDYAQVSALLLVVLAAVTVVDAIGAGIRRRLR